MFSYNEPIEDKFLWNFSPAETRRIYKEQRVAQAYMAAYQQRLTQLMCEESPAIFSNDEPKSSAPLEIKYTFNRLYKNDPRETELTLSHIDPTSPKSEPYTKQIIWALEHNTHCRKVILNGIHMSEGLFKERGLNDTEARAILTALSGKKLTELAITRAPLLGEATFSYASDLINRADNKWQHLTLGNIPVTEETEKRLSQSQRVSFRRVIYQPDPIVTAIKRLGQKIFNRGRDQ